MAYYPKSRILVGLNSTKNEFTLNGKEFIGGYFMTFDGKYYSGVPNSNNNFLLEKVEQEVTPKFTTNKDNFVFNKLNPNLNITEFIEPEPYYPIITEQDYKIGKIIRYFAKQRGIHIFKIIEIDKKTFDDISTQGGIYNYPKWQVTSLFWRINTPKNNIYSIPLEDDTKIFTSKTTFP